MLPTVCANAQNAVDVAEDGKSGLHMAENNEYDLVVLDLMLPKLPGPVVLERFRRSGHEAPVLILTARDDKPSIIRLLNTGADDCLSKPFDLGELLAEPRLWSGAEKAGPSQFSP
jgi:DNA-binding response OmpR family regulator